MRALAVALLLACGSLSAGAVSAKRLDPVEMKRLIHELRLEIDTLLVETRNFLQRRERWEPKGEDVAVWDAMMTFGRSVDHLKNTYARSPYPGMEVDVRTLLEAARDVAHQVETIRLGRRVRTTWEEMRPELDGLAGYYEWDFAEGRFTAQASAAEPRAETPDFDAPQREVIETVARRGDDPDFGRFERRFSEGDDEVVADALEKLDHLTQAVGARVGASSLETDPGAAAQGAGTPTRAAERARIEADLTTLVSAVREAQHDFALNRRASEGADEVRLVLQLARRVDDDLERANPSNDVESAWSAVRGQLNTLAVLYDFPSLAAR